MFYDIEQSLIAHLDGVLPGQPVHGSQDDIDLTADNAPKTAIQVLWLGAAVESQGVSAVKLGARFLVRIMVNAYLAEEQEYRVARAAVEEVVRRLLTFKPVQYKSAKLDDIPVPGSDGRAQSFDIYLTLSDVKIGKE